MGEEGGMSMTNFLIQNRIVFLGGYLNDELCTQTVGTLMALDAMDSSEEIKLYMNSPGGSIYNVMGLIDVMDSLKAPVSTIAFGSVSHNATLILAAGTQGKRFAMPSARIMMVQPMGGAMGSFVEVNITATELNRSLRVANEMFAKYTGKPLEDIERETDRERFMAPEQAQALGLIDGVIGGPTDVNKYVQDIMQDFKANSAWRGASPRGLS